jgi:Histidine kinase
VATISGLYRGFAPPQPMFWAASGFFILISVLIWQGNRFLWGKLRGRPDWLDHPVKRLLLLGITSLSFTTLACVALLLTWQWLAGLARPDWQLIETATLATVLSVGAIVHTYETVYLIRQRRRDRVEYEKMERARARAELAALESQVDPHFVFNSLNTLVELTEENPERATEFTLTLAEVYRYIVAHRNCESVPVIDEIGFLGKYCSLLRLRFGQGLHLHLPVLAPRHLSYRIPPASLQLLLENAVKHNEFSEESPLRVAVELHEHAIVFSNDRRGKQAPPLGANVGLRNLDERCKLVSGRGIEILDDGVKFVVVVPLVSTSAGCAADAAAGGD